VLRFRTLSDIPDVFSHARVFKRHLFHRDSLLNHEPLRGPPLKEAVEVIVAALSSFFSTLTISSMAPSQLLVGMNYSKHCVLRKYFDPFVLVFFRFKPLISVLRC